MSWLVETILLNRTNLKAEPDFESEEYNNLLIIEKKITQLYDAGRIDPFEMAVLNYVMSNRSYSELEDLLNISRLTISKHFRSICDRISFSLGSEFTDEGYIEHMREKYELKDEQIEKIRQHMNSKYRHAIRRKPHELK